MKSIHTICEDARFASKKLASLPSTQKNDALQRLSKWLVEHQDPLLEANQKDVALARQQGLAGPLLDRLTLNPVRIISMAADVLNVAALADPVGEVFEQRTLPNGLRLHKQRVPLGVLAVIYESRPNVTVDVACLALKSGNAVILRGGSETLHTNMALVTGIHSALGKAGIPLEAVEFMDDPDRERVLELFKMHEYVDLLIPRGGAELHRFCREQSTIPVITGGMGICHLFVDESADLNRSLQVIANAKLQQPTVCNALDTLLVHQSIAKQFIPLVIESLSQKGVTFRVEAATLQMLGMHPTEQVLIAGVKDFDTEWLSLVLGIRAVDSVEQAIKHIQQHSSGHSDGILTRNEDNAEKFVKAVDSAAVYVNASTRFTDGGQLGLGAEVAISTQRVHARGPMGLRELTTYKWVIQGDYQIRS
jgi:glutamate-5-semialdehyde dehydrogenase